MNVRKEEKWCVRLFFYTEKVCFSEPKSFSVQEELWLTIDAGRLHTAKPLKFLIKWSGDGFSIPGTEISRGNAYFLKTEAEESVLLVIEKEKDILKPCERLAIEEATSVSIGTEFFNEVFYEYEMFVKGTVFCIWKEKDSIWLEERIKEGKNKKRMRVYINGDVVTEKTKLEAGDVVQFLGLQIWILPTILLCISRYGSMRLSKKCGVLGKNTRKIRKAVVTDEKNREEEFLEVTNLHEGEVEIESPQEKTMQTQHPFILALGPTISMMLPMVYLSTVNGTDAAKGYYKTTISMTVLSVVLSSFWLTAGYFYRKYVNWYTEKKRQKDYRQYLRQTEKFLQQCMEENRRAMLRKYPALAEIIETESDGSVPIGEKGNEAGRFIRLGLGTVPFQMKIKLSGGVKETCRDYLFREAYEMAEGYQLLEQVPIGVDFQKVKSIGYLADNACQLAMQGILQLIAGHSGNNIKLLFFYHEQYPQERQMAQCLKWLPHIWSEDRHIRFLAGNEKEAGEILPYITHLLRNRKEREESMQYVFVIANWQLVKGESIAGLLTREDMSKVRVIFLMNERERSIYQCGCLVWEKEGKIRWYEEAKMREQKVCLEECSARQAEDYIRRMAGDIVHEEKKGIRDKVSFLDLYKCSKVEELNCLFRWKESHTRERMRVPIGKEAGNKTVYLDIHEKFHGPHGLVAGTTGAGKSELLQTYLLSLCISFSPEDINFFIIDYKGGGMGERLTALPHCSGVISNLSGAQIQRALIAIKSENIRRQEYLRSVGVSHIEEYRTLYEEEKVKIPLPHLIIVVDEFAELKREEPEFMQEIISLSQVGRSLGVHLILATQKPAGCVDERIWSNTRFRLCLRVSERQDSMDMLHRPEAVDLPGMGRGYLQVGNNEIFTEFQTGYSKEVYRLKKGEKDTVLLSNTGRRFQMPEEQQEKLPAQIDVVIDYVNQIADASHYGKVQRLWMPELPETIYLTEEAHERPDTIIMGIVDDVLKREQSPVTYEPVRDGHVCLCGGPATGKSTFLQTFLWQLCRQNHCDEVQILLASSDYAGVNCFAEMPHCMGYMKAQDEAECFFYHLKLLIYQRKTLLEGISYAQYQKRKSKKIPILFLIIDNYGKFRQLTEDKYSSLIEKIACEGMNFGVYLIITSLGIGGSDIPLKLFEKIKTTMTLEMSDAVSYEDVLRRYHIRMMPAEGCKGRGLYRCKDRILEFQVPLIGEGDDYERIRIIEQECQKRETRGSFIKKFPRIPDKGDFEVLWKEFECQKKSNDDIPIGYLAKSGEIKCIHRTKLPFVITGFSQSGKKTLLTVLLNSCHRQGLKVYLYDEQKEMKKEELWFANFVTSEEIRKKDFFVGEKMVLGVCNLAGFVKEIPYAEHMTPILAISQREEEVFWQSTKWYESIKSHQCGICLGGYPGSQRMLQFEKVGYEEMNKEKPPGYGYLKLRTEEERIRLLPYKQEV